MPQAMEAYRGQLLGIAYPRPISGRILRRKQIAFDGAENERRDVPPCPSARRSSICRFRWARSMATASGGKVILRRPRFVFGGFTRNPAFVSSTSALDTKHASVEINVAPLLMPAIHRASCHLPTQARR